jgi:PleD family two-component response regulator
MVPGGAGARQRQLVGQQAVIHTGLDSSSLSPYRPTPCSEGTRQQDPGREAAAEAPQWKVLIFDDSELCLAFGREVLLREGFGVGVARRLAEFDRLLLDWRPDVVLADILMPEIDGATLCRRLKQSMRTAHLLVVLFSNLSSAELEPLAAGCGADAYVSKTGGFDLLPITISSLCEEILW